MHPRGQARMPVLPRPDPTLRHNIPILIEAHAVGKRRGPVGTYLHETQIGNFHDSIRSFLMKAGYRESREPQDRLHFTQPPGGVDVTIWRSIRIETVIQAR